DPPSKAELRHRLQTRRSDDNAAVEARLDAARDELHAAPQYDHRVLNDDVHRAAQQLLQIIERGPSP
ncbi:MAG TPA: hypothetical protein VE219_03300, partial [Candidatus Sulfotelmatobacter sp.]|nr:hypothetical protein [Candidatus Sulfotelmatobacter sp.]